VTHAPEDQATNDHSFDERQESKMLPPLLSRFDTRQRLNILDMGPGRSETVAFFSRYRCKLNFTDLYTEPLVVEDQKTLSEWDMRLRFGKLLGLKTGERIDLVLFWDFLNYLDQPALRAFGASLRPWLHSGSRAHAFGVRADDTWLPEQRYSLISKDRLRVRSGRSVPKRSYPHTRRELGDLMPGFRIDRGTLLSDGRVELLMSAGP
jgi:hypothetical protein